MSIRWLRKSTRVRMIEIDIESLTEASDLWRLTSAFCMAIGGLQFRKKHLSKFLLLYLRRNRCFLLKVNYSDRPIDSNCMPWKAW